MGDVIMMDDKRWCTAAKSRCSVPNHDDEEESTTNNSTGQFERYDDALQNIFKDKAQPEVIQLRPSLESDCGQSNGVDSWGIHREWRQLINGNTYTERGRVEGEQVPYEMVVGVLQHMIWLRDES